MPPYRHYRNSPITEALIDIRVELTPEFKFEVLDSLSDQIKPFYPVRENMEMVQGQLSFAPNTPAFEAWPLLYAFVKCA